MLPRLLERSGANPYGTITALYTVLVDSDDMNEPIADAVRGTLDGHIVLDRKIANRGHFPAIDILASVSRLMRDIVSEDHLKAAENVKKLLTDYKEAEDLINIGAYQKGTNPNVDKAITYYPMIEEFTKQNINEPSDYKTSIDLLMKTFKEIGV